MLCVACGCCRCVSAYQCISSWRQWSKWRRNCAHVWHKSRDWFSWPQQWRLRTRVRISMFLSCVCVYSVMILYWFLLWRARIKAATFLHSQWMRKGRESVDDFGWSRCFEVLPSFDTVDICHVETCSRFLWGMPGPAWSDVTSEKNAGWTIYRFCRLISATFNMMFRCQNVNTRATSYLNVSHTSLQRSVFLCDQLLKLVFFKIKNILECGPMPNVMAALPNIGGALCSTPQNLADAHYQSSVQ